MTGLMRGAEIGFPQIEFMVRSQSGGARRSTSTSTIFCRPTGTWFHFFEPTPDYVRGYNLPPLRGWFGSASRLERAQARAGGAAVAAGLGRFSGEMRGNREQGWS